eukprot:gene24022-biopygen17883
MQHPRDDLKRMSPQSNVHESTSALNNLTHCGGRLQKHQIPNPTTLLVPQTLSLCCDALPCAAQGGVPLPAAQHTRSLSDFGGTRSTGGNHIIYAPGTRARRLVTRREDEILWPQKGKQGPICSTPPPFLPASVACPRATPLQK